MIAQKSEIIDSPDFNYLLVAVGDEGTGKSTWLVERAIVIGWRTPCYVLAYDPERRIPPKSPSGKAYPIVRLADLDALRATLARAPRAGIVYTVEATEAEELLAYAIELGEKPGPPVFVIFDESALVEGLDTYRAAKEWRRAMTGRRHIRVGFGFTLQSATIAHKLVLTRANEAALFRVGEKDTIDRLKSRGIEPSVLAALPHLPKGKFFLHKK